MDTTLSPFWRDELADAWARRYGSEAGPAALTRRPPLNPPPPPGPRPPSRIPDLQNPPPASPPPQSRRLPSAPFAVRVLAKMGYGHTAQSLAEFQALGSTDQARLAAYVEQQLNYTAINDSAVTTRLANAGYTTLHKSLSQLWADHVRSDPEYSIRMRPSVEVQRAAFVRATHSRRQLHELVTEFWHNHFNVLGTEYHVGPVMPHYDRDVIRPNALGNFRMMLEGVAKSTAMLYYLDNLNNRGGRPNENFARELLELHTMGAENYLGFVPPNAVPPDPVDPAYPRGYSDFDVYEAAAAFTGWTARTGHWEFPTENDGTFTYRATWHDSGPKTVLGMFLMPEAPPMQDGHDVLDRLASHPRVARFVCRKLIRRLVGDTVPESLVESAAGVFRQHWQASDQIARVLRHILLSPAFANTWGDKQRRPFEVTVAALRATGSDFAVRPDHSASNTLMWEYGFTGHAPFNWAAPNGYPDARGSWSGSNALAMSWRVLSRLVELSDNSVPALPLVQASRNNVSQWTANNLVDYWCQRILGQRLRGPRRQVLVDFMAQNGDPATFIITDTNTWAAANNLRAHYNHDRLCTMIAMVLASPEFFRR